eukprot:3343767-Amphidinium_carterae.1
MLLSFFLASPEAHMDWLGQPTAAVYARCSDVQTDSPLAGNGACDTKYSPTNNYYGNNSNNDRNCN